jgi:plastocyanin
MSGRRGARVRRSAGSAAALTALLLAGCGGGSPPPRRRELRIAAFAFAPAELAARPGDTLVVHNDDAVPHTATAQGKTWDTGSIAAGDSARVVIPAQGMGPYLCAFHPNMHGTLVADR